MYPTEYHSETQNEESEETSNDSYGSERETTNYITRERPLFKSLSPGEYFMSKNQIEDSDDEILAWKNALVFNITLEVEVESEPEPPYITDSDEMNENLSYSYLPELQPPKSECVEMNLGTQEDPKTIRIYKNLNLKEYEEWFQFLIKCKSASAWTYKDLKGIPREVCQHHIILEPNTKPVRHRQYRMNPKYSLMVKEEIDKLLECGFIYPVPYSEWVSPIVFVPKKNGKVRIYQDFRELNSATRKDYFPLPFTDAILDGVAGHECYSFLDGFSGYNQVQIALEDQPLTTFTTDWGTFAYNVMPFGLCNAPATLQRVMTTAFQGYLRKFIEIFLDDFCVFNAKAEHQIA